MLVDRIQCDVMNAASQAAAVRALIPAPESVADDVRRIVEDVASGGDEALLAYERKFGGGTSPLVVTKDELAAARDALDDDVRAGLEVAIANVRDVSLAGVAQDVDVRLPQGHRVRVREVPVRRAAVYAPGGEHPYPSSVVMGVVTARAAGVDRIVVAAPPHDIILGACALCGADEVYRMGGAQAIAALAIGTESVSPVDVIVGPGNLYVQEAKSLVSDRVGTDGFAGPSDLLVIASSGVDPEPLALDLLGQAEHGQNSLVIAVSDDESLLARIEERTSQGSGARRVSVLASDMLAALAFAESFAPEHLQLAGAAAEELAPRVRNAGCVFVGEMSGTAFGDYVAGANHTLPTDGRARFESGMSVRHFRRRMNEVHVGPDSAGALARAGVPIADAEGFTDHAASMAIRMRGGGHS